MRGARPGLVALVLTLLTGCVSDPGYAPVDPEARRYFGYTDTLNDDGGHTIQVVLPEGVAHPRAAFAYWERRAAELCPAGYRKQIHTARRNMMMMPGYTPSGYSYEVLGDAWCNDPAVASSTGPESGTAVAQ